MARNDIWELTALSFRYDVAWTNSGDNIVLLGELVLVTRYCLVLKTSLALIQCYCMCMTLQDSKKEHDQPHMKRVDLDKVLEAGERLNEKGNASVRQQWDFEQQH